MEAVAEVAARAAVQLIASAVETDADTRLRLFLYIRNRIREEC